MKKVDNLDFKLLQHCSGEFLTEKLPNNWDEMEDEERDDYLTGNVWEPFEDYSADQIYDFIDTAAHSLKSFLKEEGLIK